MLVTAILVPLPDLQTPTHRTWVMEDNAFIQRSLFYVILLIFIHVFHFLQGALEERHTNTMHVAHSYYGE